MATIMLFSTVGEEEEVSIKEAAEAIAEAMDFKGELLVSFNTSWAPDSWSLLGGRHFTFHQQQQGCREDGVVRASLPPCQLWFPLILPCPV